MTILDWRLRLLFLLALGCSATVGWSQVTDISVARLSGQVVDSVTGQPIARALVQAHGDHATLTDHDGNFVLDNLLPNASLPMASKPGYFYDEPASPRAGGPLVLRLTPEAVLYGTVTDTNAQPIQHLAVQLRRLQVLSGLAHWQQLQSTMTNAEGEFRFAELAAGRYSLSTGFLVDGLPDAAASLAFVPVLYPLPSADGPEGALSLRPGDHVEANLNPAAEKLYPVSGAVNGSFGRGVSFSIETREGLPVNPALHYFQDSGIFRLRLPAGSYRLKVRAQVDARTFAGTREISVGPAGLEGVSIVLAPLPSIPVEVEYQQSNPGQQEQALSPLSANVSLANEDPGSAFALLPAQPVEQSTGLRVPQPGDPLVIRDVEPAHYVLQAQTPPPWYVASASCGNLDLTREVLVVSSGSGACSLRIVLRDDSATLHWSIVDHEATRSTLLTVMAFPLASLTQTGSNMTVLGAEGAFTGLAPGRYLVIAARRLMELPYRDPEALEKYRPLGKEVTLEPNGDAEIELEPAAGEP